MSFQELTELFNHNLSKIKRELNSNEVMELTKKHKAEDDGHLAKILSNRKIRL